MALFIRSPFGQSLAGCRDQPRRTRALGYHVPLIQWLSFVYAGFWGVVAGLLYGNYHQFVSPQALNLTTSAETLLMVIAGGAGALSGPVAGAARRWRSCSRTSPVSTSPAGSCFWAQSSC